MIVGPLENENELSRERGIGRKSAGYFRKAVIFITATHTLEGICRPLPGAWRRESAP